jgi:hypothetical protein
MKKGMDLAPTCAGSGEAVETVWRKLFPVFPWIKTEAVSETVAHYPRLMP